MLKLAGYQIYEPIYSSIKTLVFRGLRSADQKPVVIKLLRSEYPSFNEQVQFRNQYTIAKDLNLEGIIQTYSLETYRNSYALIMEDFGGISLFDWRLERNSVFLTEFFHIALQLVTALDGLYRHRIIHKDIKPSNILINPTTHQVKLIDFSLASLLPRENPTLISPNLLEGTLPYLSPEQTGRMNRGIDWRSDFYSLGVTFFELLTGQLPFCSSDPIELVYSHLAKQPPKAHSINPEIPLVLSNIISKLIAKNPEDRYQNVLGLKHDLEKCLHQWQENQSIDIFELGQQDISERFAIPEKLYGREKEVDIIIESFNRVCAGKTEFMLVAGFSGIGKTVVVNAVQKPIVRQRGYFIRGKYDQFQKNIPFSAFVQAFRDLIQQLLSESDAQLQQWKAKLLLALGENGQVIIDVIPELENIIGEQPSVIELSGNAATNRFNLLFKKFIQVFTTQDHPLVIFLDDLQWADSASLKLLQLLLSEFDIRYLLLIGAYRDNEVFAAHPLLATLEEIGKLSVTINTITLSTLKKCHIKHLIADTLICSSEIAETLMELVYQKTKGTPFFINYFLKSLNENELIKFNFKTGSWECDISQIRDLVLADDVVEFLKIQLQNLPKKTQEVLKFAACIGNSFNLKKLSIVCEHSLIETAFYLWQALQEGFIVPKNEAYKFFQKISETDITDNLFLEKINIWSVTQNIENITYQFSHDRVQQAAYLLIPDRQKQFIHLKIGQLLLKNTSDEEQEEIIFDIVNHLNIAAQLINEQCQKYQLIKLNFNAGCKAKLSTAYEPAVRYFNYAISLLDTDSWQNHYEITLAVYLEAAETEYLNTNCERAMELTELIQKQAITVLDRVKAFQLKIQLYQTQSQMLKAIDTGMQVLEMLEVPWVKQSHKSSTPTLPALTDLEHIAVMTDPYKLAALQILTALYPPVYIAKPKMVPQLIQTMVNLCTQNGYSALAAYAYVLYGMLLCNKGDIESGYHAGKLALVFLEKFHANALKAKVYVMFNAHIRIWKESAINTCDFFLKALQSGLEFGDVEWACYSAMHYCKNLFIVEKHLDVVEKQQLNYIDFLQKNKHLFAIAYAQIWQQITFKLQVLSNTDNKSLFSTEDSEQEILLKIWQKEKNYMSLFAAYLVKLIILYLFHNYSHAVNIATIGKKYSEAALGLFTICLHNFYYSLALLADYPHVTKSQQVKYLRIVGMNQQKMKKWAEYAPSNFQHKYDLVKAEKAKLLGQYWQAADFYDRAIAGAKEQGYIQEEALANELAAKFYLECKKEKIALVYLTEAYYCYIRWGAMAKVKDLETRYAELLNSILTPSPSHLPSDPTLSLSTKVFASSTTALNSLDMMTVVQASQALSGEIHLEQLLSTLIQVVMKNAGADKCVLMLLKDNNWVIEAIAKSEGSQEIQPRVLQSIPIDDSLEIPCSIIHYVSRSLETIVIDSAVAQISLESDPYIQLNQPKSFLCTPIIKQGKLIGILYLESTFVTGVFTHERLEILKLLTTQAAIALENAQLYTHLSQTSNQLKQANEKLEDYAHTLEQKVEERTQELSQKANQLETTLQELYSAQSQLIQTEKMSSLGQLVAGIAHEINNPISFIYSNLTPANEYVISLIELVKLYQKFYPNPNPEIEEKKADIELDFLLSDLQKILASMHFGAKRIQQIVLSLRNFSRLDEAEKKSVDIHSGIDSTLLLLKHRLKASDPYPKIEVIKEYAQIPEITCYASALNQVFINLLNNAIDALQQMWCHESSHNKKPTITIRTGMKETQKAIVSIADNGCGIEETVLPRIFDPFFTTKPIGKGTGLGLSISYAIVVEKHRGQLTCVSKSGLGAEFIIEIPLK
ncbi:AAA family ATPase [Tolypothrix campylonemoides VB511288_2]|uniref:histidine kinase n=1 Tax=Tolypothrix campylonemoides VB511288_2 TaxID=3232311 RepID=A0ABW8XK97_9CYAN